MYPLLKLCQLIYYLLRTRTPEDLEPLMVHFGEESTLIAKTTVGFSYPWIRYQMMPRVMSLSKQKRMPSLWTHKQKGSSLKAALTILVCKLERVLVVHALNQALIGLDEKTGW